MKCLRKCSKDRDWFSMLFDGFMVTPVQGCRLYFCEDHLSSIGKKSKEVFTGDTITINEYGPCIGC